MALLKTVLFGECDEMTYHRISHVVVLAPGERGRVKVESFSDLSRRYSALEANWFLWFDVEWNGNTNYIGDAYAYLKTLPEWANAEDA